MCVCVCVFACMYVYGQPVVTDYEAKCSTGTPITLTADTGYVVNHVAFNPSTLRAVCTWRIRVAAGQRIALTLYDFGRHRSRVAAAAAAASTAAGDPPDNKPSSASRTSSAAVCRKYAVVREPGRVDNYFREGGYAFICVWLFVCQQDYSEATDQIFVKFYGMVGHNRGTNRSDFE